MRRDKEYEDASRTDQIVAAVRWFVYLATVAAFLMVWLLDLEGVTLSLDSSFILLLAGTALFYNLVVSGLAHAGWLTELLPAGTIAADVLLAALAYFGLGPAADALCFAIDPLILAALLPALTASLRFGWRVGILVGLVMGGIRSGLLLWGLPVPGPGYYVALSAFSVFVLAGPSFLVGFVGYVGDLALRQGLIRKLKETQRTVDTQRAALERGDTLQEMTTVMSAARGFEFVLDLALEIVEEAMAEWGAKGQLIGMVFLFDDNKGMRLAASCNLPRYDWDRGIPGESGIVARCLEEAELVVTDSPANDPELSAFTGIADCRVAVAVPLHVGFENYGAMALATGALEGFDEGQSELFAAVGDRAAIALNNSMLYQKLQAEKDRLVAVEEQARHKLSRDLHDGPTQSISAVAMRINFARKALVQDPERLAEELEIIENMARQTMKDIRHMLFTLRPLVLETKGLVPALQSLADKVSGADDLNIQLREIDGAASHLDANQAGVIFYIVEEALGNARKYSEADLIEIRLWTEEDLFVAQVADDGVGFNTQEVLGNYETRGSLGMVNMRERAALIDGSLDIKSEPGRGTTITLLVPLRGDAAAA
jgi:signal transduction histidine kinase